MGTNRPTPAVPAAVAEKHSPSMAITQVLESEHVNIKKVQSALEKRGWPAFPPKFTALLVATMVVVEAIRGTMVVGAQSHACTAGWPGLAITWTHVLDP